MPASSANDGLAFDLPGSGSDAALLLHGLSGSPFEVRFLADRLNSRGIRCRGPVLPGHGGDAADLLNVRWEDWVEAGLRELDVLEGARRTWLIGSSMGALVACAMAFRRPERIHGLALLSPALRLRGLSLLAGLAGHYTILPRLLPIVPKVGGSDIRDAEMRRLNPCLKAVALQAVGQLVAFGRAVDRLLPGIATPAVIIVGGQDHTVALSGARRMSRRLGGPPARVVVLRESFHLVGIDVERADCADEVGRFFASLP